VTCSQGKRHRNLRDQGIPVGWPRLKCTYCGRLVITDEPPAGGGLMAYTRHLDTECPHYPPPEMMACYGFTGRRQHGLM
jgi:hypothetical protein